MKVRIDKAVRLRTGSKATASFEIPAAYQPDYAELVRRSPDVLTVEMSIPKKHRTTGSWSQSHHFNGHIQQIASETGNDFADLKLYVKRRAMAQGLPYLMHDGKVVYSMIDGEPLPISESDMSTIECGWCIDACHILASELGIVLKETDDA
jgi:hypothetical protein